MSTAAPPALTAKGADWKDAFADLIRQLNYVIKDIYFYLDLIQQYAQYGGSDATAPDAPVGSIVAWPSETVPDNWLECNGATINSQTYTLLFDVIGYTFGGSGVNFSLPDLRGKFIRGWAHGSANDPDRASRTDGGDGVTGDHAGTNQADGFESHQHLGHYSYFTGFNSVLGGGVNQYIDGAIWDGATGGNETRPINTNMMWIIKYI